MARFTSLGAFPTTRLRRPSAAELALPTVSGAPLPFQAIPKRRIKGLEIAAIAIAVISLIAIVIFAFMLSRMR